MANVKHQEYTDHRAWIEALREAVSDEEDCKEGKRLKGNNFLGLNSRGKRKRDEPTRARTIKKLEYSAKERRVYQLKKKEEKVDKGKVAQWQKIKDRVWADAHTCIDQKPVKKPKAKGQCTRGTLTNDGWKHCQKEIRVSTIQRKLSNLPGRRSNHPKSRKPGVTAVAEDSHGETSRQASQRPPPWTFMEDEEQ